MASGRPKNVSPSRDDENSDEYHLLSSSSPCSCTASVTSSSRPLRHHSGAWLEPSRNTSGASPAAIIACTFWL